MSMDLVEGSDRCTYAGLCRIVLHVSIYMGGLGARSYFYRFFI
jgi:hypothetical protein